jgi:hypothetical protein
MHKVCADRATKSRKILKGGLMILAVDGLQLFAEKIGNGSDTIAITQRICLFEYFREAGRRPLGDLL